MTPAEEHVRRIRGWLLLPATVLMSVAILSVPSFPPEPVAVDSERQAFVWNQDSLWNALEAQYASARGGDCAEMQSAIDLQSEKAMTTLGALERSSVGAEATELDSLETTLFQLGPLVAACASAVPAYANLYAEMRRVVKRQSRDWDMASAFVRDRLYRLLYGGRAAVEEVMLHHPDRVVTLMPGVDEASEAPSAVLEGVRLHSGDILVSRGGYPTSALISRGSDFPGNFSHVALVHIDESGRVSIIEAHIEIGVAIASPERYLQDKKLRIMVLRPRADLPALVNDPLLPHRAASLALLRAKAKHIPYDFEMDYTDPSKLFCSEVASSVYREFGLTLWMGLSTISGPGLRRWLAGFGVTHFATQEPSDLEYDPQLAVVAEWRDATTLMADHIGNAVTDAMLEGAERGDQLDHAWYRLPAARLAKAYSWVRERFGSFGPVPEGMSAAAALRNREYSRRHNVLSSGVGRRSDAFAAEAGYPPPYWKLLEMARAEAKAQHRLR